MISLTPKARITNLELCFILQGDSCSDASDSETEAPDHSPEKRTAPTYSKLLEDKTNAVLQLNDGEQLKSLSIDSTPKNFSDGCSEK